MCVCRRAATNSSRPRPACFAINECGAIVVEATVTAVVALTMILLGCDFLVMTFKAIGLQDAVSEGTLDIGRTILSNPVDELTYARQIVRSRALPFGVNLTDSDMDFCARPNLPLICPAGDDVGSSQDLLRVGVVWRYRSIFGTYIPLRASAFTKREPR